MIGGDVKKSIELFEVRREARARADQPLREIDDRMVSIWAVMADLIDAIRRGAIR